MVKATDIFINESGRAVPIIKRVIGRQNSYLQIEVPVGGVVMVDAPDICL